MYKFITREFSFDSSHRLSNPKLSDDENEKIFGKCFNIPSHGHTYKLLVTVSGKESNGMIINFTDLKNIVNTNIIDIFDHRFINDLECMKDKITTCETMVKVIWEILEPLFNCTCIILEKIKLYETPNSYCELVRENEK